MRVLAIDPGSTGALALLDGETLLHVYDMPILSVLVGKTLRSQVSPALVANVLKDSKPDRVIIEQVGTRPGEGAVGAFSFGRSFGILQGVVAALEIPCEYVHPAVWKRALNVPADKGGARMKAIALFPYKANEFKRVKDDGRAEAALLGLYAVRKQ